MYSAERRESSNQDSSQLVLHGVFATETGAPARIEVTLAASEDGRVGLHIDARQAGENERFDRPLGGYQITIAPEGNKQEVPSIILNPDGHVAYHPDWVSSVFPNLDGQMLTVTSPSGEVPLASFSIIIPSAHTPSV